VLLTQEKDILAAERDSISSARSALLSEVDALRCAVMPDEGTIDPG